MWKDSNCNRSSIQTWKLGWFGKFRNIWSCSRVGFHLATYSATSQVRFPGYSIGSAHAERKAWLNHPHHRRAPLQRVFPLADRSNAPVAQTFVCSPVMSGLLWAEESLVFLPELMIFSAASCCSSCLVSLRTCSNCSICRRIFSFSFSKSPTVSKQCLWDSRGEVTGSWLMALGCNDVVSGNWIISIYTLAGFAYNLHLGNSNVTTHRR